jgi:uncharacterized cysteine cluster protein YcgN (CxxCxxCC family)
MLLFPYTRRLFCVQRKHAYFTTLTIILVAHELWYFEEKRCAKYANKVGLVKDTCIKYRQNNLHRMTWYTGTCGSNGHGLTIHVSFMIKCVCYIEALNPMVS